VVGDRHVQQIEFVVWYYESIGVQELNILNLWGVCIIEFFASIVRGLGYELDGSLLSRLQFESDIV